MCRLFGFRSVIQSQVHRSLVEADNALWSLSEQHPDGWGVAYYVEGTPHVARSAMTALRDRMFKRVSGVVASETVVAHVRKATQGNLSVLNCHPFQHGRWVFAHNGDVPGFGSYRAALLRAISPGLRRYILGDTDSEVLFFLFLTRLNQLGPLSGSFPMGGLMSALGDTLAFVRSLCDPKTGSNERSLLTCVVTDGASMVGVQGGKELHYSTYKRRCPDRAVCPHLAAACEAPTASGRVNHLIFSSEPLTGDNVWHAMSEGDMVAVDAEMTLHYDRVPAMPRAQPIRSSA